MQARNDWVWRVLNWNVFSSDLPVHTPFANAGTGQTLGFKPRRRPDLRHGHRGTIRLDSRVGDGRSWLAPDRAVVVCHTDWRSLDVSGYRFLK